MKMNSISSIILPHTAMHVFFHSWWITWKFLNLYLWNKTCVKKNQISWKNEIINKSFIISYELGIGPKLKRFENIKPFKIYRGRTKKWFFKTYWKVFLVNLELNYKKWQQLEIQQDSEILLQFIWNSLKFNESQQILKKE